MQRTDGRALTLLVSSLVSASMTVDALQVAWPPLSTLNGSLLHMPITGAGRPYPILRGAGVMYCAGDAAGVMYCGGEAELAMLATGQTERQEPAGREAL
jgi:hypothetical protein